MLLALDKCNELKNKTDSPSGDKVKSITLVIHDTCWYHLEEKGKPKATDSIFISVPAIVDTEAILHGYFAKYVFADTLSDTSIVIAVKDTISENRIVSRELTYRIKRPQVIEQINNTTIPRRIGLYVGVSASINKNLLAGFSPEILLTGKNKTAYGIGYDLLSKSVSAHVYWKLNLRP